MFMVQHYLPSGMRYSTLDERKDFYSKKFDLQKVVEWFGDRLVRTKFAVIMGKHTKIFLEKYREDADTTIIIDEYTDLNDVQAQVLGFLPEAVYYDRNIYDEDGQITGQELAFDIDPENITCPIHGTLEDKMARGQGLSFCALELGLVKSEVIGLLRFLEKRFSLFRVVYSGRGFHIPVFDKMLMCCVRRSGCPLNRSQTKRVPH